MASCMNLMRRLPPKENQKNLTAICELIGDEELKDEVLLKTDQPLCKLQLLIFIFNRNLNG